MAQSWQRLIDGKNIKEQDIILLKHELSERFYMKQGLSQTEAHEKANIKYNYEMSVKKEEK
jgi:hypothetical protein